MPSWLSKLPSTVLLDRKWVRQSFLLSGDDVANSKFRIESLAEQKFTNSRLGGNWTINNPPQFTRYADPRDSGLFSKNDWYKNADAENIGMGHYYSDALDSTRQEIALQFGVPQYNGMLTFFTGFYDNETAVMANEGLGVIGYYVGRIAGLIVSLPFIPLILIGEAARFLLGRPSSKYYYMRETMPLYWNRVNVIANGIAVNMGLVPKAFSSLAKPSDGATPKLEAEDPDVRNAAYVEYFHNAQQDIFLEKGGIDVYALANRTQRMADARYQKMIDSLDAAVTDDKAAILDRMNKFRSEQVSLVPDRFKNEEGEGGINGAIYDYFKTRSILTGPNNSKQFQTDSRTQQDVSTISAEAPAGATPEQTQSNAAAAAASSSSSGANNVRPVFRPTDKAIQPKDGESIPGADIEYEQEIKHSPASDPRNGFLNYYMADRRDGSKFVRFRVDYGGSVSESFSSSVGESSIQSNINSTSSSARSARFAIMDGNTGIDPIDGIMNALKGVVTGAMDSLQVSGLMSLAGSAFVDIPKHWQSSSADFPSTRYSMELRSPYGNHMSRFINLYVPLACLLAGALPLSTGKQSYTSPFLCQLWHRGHAQVRLGMIDSLSITRGVGGLGWNNNNECLAIDVSFNVVDLSTIMHAPIDTGFSILKPWKGLLQDGEDPFNNYLAVLGNLSMADQIYSLRRLILNLTRKSNQIDAYFTKAHAASALDEFWPTRWVGQTISAFVRASEGTIPTNN